MLENSRKTILTAYEDRWRGLLSAALDLCEACVHPPADAIDHTFPHPWIELGPGYVYGPAFGHWDIVHTAFNFAWDDPDEAMRQLENNFSLMCDDGLLIGAIFFRLAGGGEASHEP